ncbi:MAG: hypothetical protein NW201_07115 [Gemmatimonadales bacterium]|nr:hypothetical protein [Gemmatimonadales bacterium]
MSAPYERPDRAALDELELLIRHLTDELAGWRRRALRAEQEAQELRALAAAGGPASAEATTRIAALEEENAVLRARVDSAKARVQLLSSRLAFLDQGGDPS